MTNQLDNAYNLIKSGDKQSAIDILEPIIRDNPNNEDAWWLYANAIDDEDAKRNAVNNVLRLSSDESRTQKAQSMLYQLDPPDADSYDFSSEATSTRDYQETAEQSATSGSGMGKVILAIIGTIGACALVSCGLLYFFSFGLLDQLDYPDTYDDMGALLFAQPTSGTLTEEMPVDGYTLNVQDGGTLDLTVNVNEEIILFGVIYDDQQNLIGIAVLSDIFSTSSVGIPEGGDYLLTIVSAELFGRNFGYGDYEFTAELR